VSISAALSILPVSERGMAHPYASAEAHRPACFAVILREGPPGDAAYQVEGVTDSPDAPDSPDAHAAPDPFDDIEALEDLGDEIATLAAHIHAAAQRMLVLLAEFDRRRGWEIGGHRSCAHWLAYRAGSDLGAARERVRTARALVSLPLTSASMARGELSFSQVRALSRVATEDNEGELLEFARGATTAQIERLVRGWRRASRMDEVGWERERHERRTFSVFPDEDGMYVVKGRLEPEVGALLMRAIEAAADASYRRSPGSVAEDEATSRRASAQRRADGVALLAERAMGAGFGEDRALISGTRAERYQVVVHVDEDTLKDGLEAPDRSHLEDGTRVSAETSRRLACDAGVVSITRARDGSVVDVGRRTRSIPPALRRALEARDGGCRFPGCGLRFTDGHHVKHWADGGETGLGNCLLLCKFHHRLVHEGGWSVSWWGHGRPAFFDPRGGAHFDGRWGAPAGVDTESLIEENRRHGAEPDYRTAGAKWKREKDIPGEVGFRAMEALA
jgi:Domain of unknown function (DUF222)